MKKLYGGINMSWLKTIIFAIITGTFTGAVMLIPALDRTSFQDIGVSFEWWVIFAVIIVVNCKKNWEAMLKCFVFFLISQPLVYGVEILFGDLTLQLAKNYYFGTWFKMTFATLPGGFIAYYCKKQNLFGSIVLGLGNTIQAAMAVYYIPQMISHFPYHTLTVAVCIASIIVMSMYIQKEKKYRIISMVIPVVLALGMVAFTKVTGIDII